LKLICVIAREDTSSVRGWLRAGAWLLFSAESWCSLAVEADVPPLAGVEDPPLTAVGMTVAASGNFAPASCSGGAPASWSRSWVVCRGWFLCLSWLWNVLQGLKICICIEVHVACNGLYLATSRLHLVSSGQGA
jgi:hypothetical protein